MRFVGHIVREITHTCCTTVACTVFCSRRWESEGKCFHRHRQIHTRDRSVAVCRAAIGLAALIYTRRGHIIWRGKHHFILVIRCSRAVCQAAEVVFTLLEANRTGLNSRVSYVCINSSTTDRAVCTQPGQGDG